MIVHQAIYGDKSGSYALLKTSLTDTDRAKRICNVTDLLDRPSNGYLTQSVVRGFAFADTYLFIKSFPDNDPSVRKGRVLSHTLIVEQDDLHLLNDLEELFSYFLAMPSKNLELKPVVLDNNMYTTQTINHKSRESAAINGLLDHSSHNNTLVWIGVEGYLSLITQIWSQLDGDLRTILRLGVGFNPQKIDTQKLNVLYVMEEYENKWKASDFCVIGKADRGTLISLSSFLLAGDKDKSKPLIDLIKIFGMVPTDVEDFIYIETGVATYKELSPATDFNRLIVLCDLVSKYSPDQKISKKDKHKLLLEVISRISSSSAEKIFKLKNGDWKGFFNGQQLIGQQITNWVVMSLFDFKIDKSIAKIISAAFDNENAAHWWKKAFSDGIKAKLEKWEASYAKVLWECFLEEHNLVNILEDFIPIAAHVEDDFICHWHSPGHELAENIQVFSKDRNWLSLYGLSTLQLLSPEESIKTQLEIDTDPNYFVALNRMGELISDKKFLQLTVKIGELRLVKIAGKRIVRTPSLISQLDVKNIICRQILLECVEQGMQPCNAIKEPTKVLFSLLEEVIKGVEIESKLLFKFIKSDYNDLSSFKLRSEVWKHFDADVKYGFIRATTLGCVRLLDKKNISLNDLEIDIRDCLSTSDVISQIISDQSISVSTKILLFNELPALKENELLKLLNSVRFPLEESGYVGKLIFRNHWRKAAETIANKISVREDLKPALKECQSLLGYFEKLRLSFSGHLTETVSIDEWWTAFSNQCYTKYAKGPADKGLWGRSDGEHYDLPTTGTGREIWMDVISKMRNKSVDIDVQKLLQEMSKDYPNSNELKQLKRAYK